MRKTVLLLIFLSLIFLTKAQTKLDSLLSEVEKLQHEVFNQRVFTLAKTRINNVFSDSKTFENQGIYNSTYLILNNDSSFIYYSDYEVGSDLTTGRWSRLNLDTFILNWDKAKALAYTNNKQIYRQYFQSGEPSCFPMTNWLIKITVDKIEPVSQGNKNYNQQQHL